MRSSQRADTAQEVEHREVLHVLAQADAAGVRADGHLELGGEEEDGEHLVDAAEPAAVDLRNVDRVGLEELLEHHPVVAVLAGRDPDRPHRLGDTSVPEDVVGARRLLDPPRFGVGQGVDPVDGLIDVPHLVGVDEQAAVRAELLAQDPCAAHIVVEVAPDLDLQVVPTGRPALRGTAPATGRRDTPTSPPT